MPYTKEQQREQNHNYYIANREKRLQQIEKWKSEHPAKARKHECNRTLVAIAILGGSCVACGETDPLVLEFDHINNNGSEHRKEIGGKTHMPRWITDNPDDARAQLQLLCANCHARKHSALRHCIEVM